MIILKKIQSFISEKRLIKFEFVNSQKIYSCVLKKKTNEVVLKSHIVKTSAQKSISIHVENDFILKLHRN